MADNPVVTADATTPVAAAPAPRVNIRDDSGEVRNVAPEELADAQAAGWHPETHEEWTQRRKQEVYGGFGGTVAAAAAGALRGLTFGGGSDVVAAKAGLVDPEILRDLKEVNPKASTIGEIGGTVGGAFLGGESLLGGAVRAGERVGTAAESWLTKKLGETALAKIAAKTGGTTAEGALYGLGQVSSEAALGDHELTAEHLISTVGLSALMAGGLAGTLSGAGVALRAAAKGAEMATGGAARLYGAAAQRLGKDLNPDLVEAAVKAKAAGEGTFTAKIAGRDVGISAEGYQDTSRQLYDQLKFTKDALDKIGREASGARPQEVRNILEAAEDTGIARQKANDLAGNVRTAIAEMEEGAKSETFSTGTAKRVKKFLQGTPEDAAEGAEVAPSKGSFLDKINDPAASHADIFDAANEMKRKLADEARYDLRPDQFSALPVPEQGSIDKARDLYKKFQAHLEDESVYGEAAARQAAYNRSTTDFIGSQKEFKRLFCNQDGDVASEKVQTYLRQMGTVHGARRENAITNWMDKGVAYTEQASQTLKATGNAIDNVERLNAATQLKQVKAHAIEAMEQINQMRALGIGMPLLDDPGQLVEGALRMGRGEGMNISALGLAAKVAKTVMEPAAVVRVLGSINKAARTAQEKIITNADRLMSGSIGKAVRSGMAAGAGAAAAKLITGFAADTETPTERVVPMAPQDRTPIKRRAMEYLQASANPTQLQDAVGKSIAGLEHAAPKFAGALAAKMVAGNLFLAQKAQELFGMPPNNSILPSLDRWDIPKSTLASFERYMVAVHDPHSIMTAAASGRGTPEGVEAVRTVYPQIYQQIVAATVQRLSALKTPPSYAMRIHIGQLIGQPLDRLADPTNLAILAKSSAAGESSVQAQLAPPAPAKPLNTSRMKFAGDSGTTQQRLMAG